MTDEVVVVFPSAVDSPVENKSRSHDSCEFLK